MFHYSGSEESLDGVPFLICSALCGRFEISEEVSNVYQSVVLFQPPLECIGKLNLLKAQLGAFNTSDSTTIPLTVHTFNRGKLRHMSRIPRISSWIPVTNA